jgi:hypothetical protein
MKSNSPFKQDKCTAAWEKKKASYMSRKSKTGLDMSKKDETGKFPKKEIPISEKENLAEYNREKGEFECVNGKIVLKKTGDDK